MVLSKIGNHYVSITTEQALQKAHARIDEAERLERRFGYDHQQQIDWLLQEANDILADLERENPSTSAQISARTLDEEDGDPSEDLKALARTNLWVAEDCLGLNRGELGIRWDNTNCPDAPRGATCNGHVDRADPHLLHLNPKVKRDDLARVVGHESWHAKRVIQRKSYGGQAEETDAEGFGQWLARRLSGHTH